LQARLKDENIDLRLLPGREYYLDEFLFDYLKDPLPLGETKYIMLEIPNHIAPEFVKEACFRIKRSGFIPMIAHPERCSLFGMLQKQANAWLNLFNSELKIENSKLLTYLISLGCAFQANLGSFAGWYGSQVQQVANRLKKTDIYTHFGTDAHNIMGVLQHSDR
jgi:protein-tyrosine phosphatase